MPGAGRAQRACLPDGAERVPGSGGSGGQLPGLCGQGTALHIRQGCTSGPLEHQGAETLQEPQEGATQWDRGRGSSSLPQMAGRPEKPADSRLRTTEPARAAPSTKGRRRPCPETLSPPRWPPPLAATLLFSAMAKVESQVLPAAHKPNHPRHLPDWPPPQPGPLRRTLLTEAKGQI